MILQEGHLKLLQCDKTTHFVLFGLRSGWQLVFGGKHDIFRNSDKKNLAKEKLVMLSTQYS